MHRTFVVLLVSLIAVAPLRARADATQIVMLGDSLTARGNWKQLLGRTDVANRGIDGDTIRGATMRVRQVIRLQPRTVIVMLGINDLIHGRSPVACVADMRRLLERLRAGLPSARVVVSSVLPVGESLARLTPRIEQLNRGLVGLCAEAGCEYLDVASEFEPRGLSRDDLHLSAAGYSSWASVVRRDILESRSANRARESTARAPSATAPP